MKISQADKYFSMCIRESHDHTCEMCGKQGRMECSHVYGRRHRIIRWDKQNANCLCGYCHRKWHEKPLEASAWFIEKFGQQRIDLLREKMQQSIKVSKQEEKDIARHYQKEYNSLIKQRDSGKQGKLDFESWQ